MSQEQIGFIGLGKMGRPMAANLAAKGFKVQAYDVRPEAAQGLEQEGVTWAGSIRRLAETSSVIFTIVFSGEQVKKIVLEADGILDAAAPETILVEMTTSDPSITRELGPRCEEKKVRLIDAPVSGGVASAYKGTLTFMVGGEERYLDRVRPLLEIMGDKINYMGPLGSGHAMKLMNNFLSAATLAATTEVVALARKAGIPTDRVVEVLRTSTGSSDASNRKFPQYIFPDLEIGFPIELMYKDVKTYLRFAEKAEIPTFISSAVFQLWHLNMVEGSGPQDAIHFVGPYEKWCGKPIRGLSKGQSEDV